MPQVYQPKKKQNDGLGKALTIGGVVAGGFVGGPSGAMAGAGAGQMAGGLLSKPQTAPIQVPAEQSAMSRKLNSVEDDPLLKLQESQAALATMPPPIQKQYGPALQQATLAEQQKRGMV